MGQSESIPKRKYIALHTYLKKQENFPLNYLTLQLKKLERNIKQNLKLVEQGNNKDQRCGGR